MTKHSSIIGETMYYVAALSSRYKFAILRGTVTGERGGDVLVTMDAVEFAMNIKNPDKFLQPGNYRVEPYHLFPTLCEARREVVQRTFRAEAG